MVPLNMSNHALGRVRKWQNLFYDNRFLATTGVGGILLLAEPYSVKLKVSRRAFKAYLYFKIRE